MKSQQRQKVERVLGLIVILVGIILYLSVKKEVPKPVDQTPEPGFSKEWFDLQMENIPIPPDEEGKADLTRNFYFILDGSGSMREATSDECGGDQQFIDKIVGARWAIKKFLEQVPPDVNIGLYIFDSQGRREVIPLSIADQTNRQAFIAAVEGVQAGGGTPLADSIRYGAEQLIVQYKKQFGYGEFRLVVVTDGLANSIPEAALYAARMGIPIYAIGLCVGEQHPLRQYSVSYRAADNFTDLARSLQETLAELPSYNVAEFE